MKSKKQLLEEQNELMHKLAILLHEVETGKIKINR